jgi:hypothetical protein
LGVRCANCEREFDERQCDCPYCGAVPEHAIHQRPSGKRSESGGQWREDGRGYQERPGARFRQVTFGSGVWSQLLLVIIALFAIFVLLPAFVFLALGMAAAWFIYRLFKG